MSNVWCVDMGFSFIVVLSNFDLVLIFFIPYFGYLSPDIHSNLPFSFDIDDIKDIYHWRWGIETTFRYLKHANGLLHFH